MKFPLCRILNAVLSKEFEPQSALGVILRKEKSIRTKQFKELNCLTTVLSPKYGKYVKFATKC